MKADRKYGLNGSQLKLLAMIFMFIDHSSYLLSSFTSNNKNIMFIYVMMRIIGRMAFPIFGFLAAEGVLHTRNIFKYIGRLAIFALISEGPYDLYFYSQNNEWMKHCNTFFTLLLGVICITIIQRIEKLKTPYFANVFLILLTVAGFACVSDNTGCDYGAYGVAMIVSYYMWTSVKVREPVPTIMATFITLPSSIMQIFVLPASLLLSKYNSKRGNLNKWVGYLFYPIHIALLLAISACIHWK